MKRTNPIRYSLIVGLAIVVVAAPDNMQSQTMAPQAQTQQVPSTTPPVPSTTPPDRDDVTRRQLASFDSFLDRHPEIAEQLRKDPSLVDREEFVENHPQLQQYLQQHPEIREEIGRNPNGFMHQENALTAAKTATMATLRGDELANMDRFMDSHPEVAEQLRKNPALVDNKEFVENHPALQQFLKEHPEVREEYKENPNAFMHQEERFDRREDHRDGDLTRGELANMDRFMDSHPEVAEQLRKNPALVDNKEFVENHPALQQFLKEHPEVREEYKENPNAFMHQEQRFDRREDRRDSDLTRGELANMDRFMDSHPEVAEQLRKDPALVDNKEFVENHPALQQFLAEHPEVREEYKENPNAFMHQEQRFDRHEDSSTMRRDQDVTGAKLSSFNEFMGSHDRIADELSKDPSLAKNEEYLENRPALRDYLKAHPEVHEELSENPAAFIKTAQQFNTHTTAKVAGQSKPK